MKRKLKELKSIVAENCITIILNTHRTMPDNQQDKILLKNLVTEAENRLVESIDKRVAANLIERIKELESTIDHTHNLESLILFVNEDIAEIVRLPIKVEDRVIIGDTFATRDLMRTLHLNSSYYVLVLGRDRARLIEAFNNKVIKEVGKPFPFENTQLFGLSQYEAGVASVQSKAMAEYYNQVDKLVNEVRKDSGLPVLISSDEANFHEYIKVADHKDTIYQIFLGGSRLEDKDSAIVKDAWEIIKAYVNDRNNKRITELETATGKGNFRSDINDIWRATKEGQIQTLFVEQGLFKPAILKNDEIELVSEDKSDHENYVDDILDELLELNMSFGGENVFLPKGKLDKYNGYGAITRY
ncbi:MAG TPA: hypothetical protein VFD77_00840 [Brumimicrobium sp.]|nr:hypothetical protein [Brumimicrobium sp.]